jgi:hypothetical protein
MWFNAPPAQSKGLPERFLNKPPLPDAASGRHIRESKKIREQHHETL